MRCASARERPALIRKIGFSALLPIKTPFFENFNKKICRAASQSIDLKRGFFI
jgi:hypothetical protein